MALSQIIQPCHPAPALLT